MSIISKGKKALSGRAKQLDDAINKATSGKGSTPAKKKPVAKKKPAAVKAKKRTNLQKATGRSKVAAEIVTDKGASKATKAKAAKHGLKADKVSNAEFNSKLKKKLKGAKRPSKK